MLVDFGAVFGAEVKKKADADAEFAKKEEIADFAKKDEVAAVIDLSELVEVDKDEGKVVLEPEEGGPTCPLSVDIMPSTEQTSVRSNLQVLYVYKIGLDDTKHGVFKTCDHFSFSDLR